MDHLELALALAALIASALLQATLSANMAILDAGVVELFSAYQQGGAVMWASHELWVEEAVTAWALPDHQLIGFWIFAVG